MTQELIQTYEAIYEKSARIRELEEEIKALKAKVREYHGDMPLIVEDGWQSQITHTVRDTPQIRVIASKFGIEDLDFAHHPDCFRRSEYDSISVRRLDPAAPAPGEPAAARPA